MTIKEILQSSLQDQQDTNDKLLFLGNCVFDFTTYVDDYTRHFAAMMIRTLQRIQDGTNFEFIGKSDENHIEYLTTVNMIFLQDRLDWGTSIRGAWFDPKSQIDISDFHYESDLVVPFPEFVKNLLEWYNEPQEIIIE